MSLKIGSAVNKSRPNKVVHVPDTPREGSALVSDVDSIASFAEP